MCCTYCPQDVVTGYTTSTVNLSGKQWCVQAVLNYSEEQIADLIVLKTLLVRRFHEIHQKRTATLEVLAQHAKAGEARLDTAHELTTASLTNLNAQTYQTYAEWHVAFRFGVSPQLHSASLLPFGGQAWSQLV